MIAVSAAGLASSTSPAVLLQIGDDVDRRALAVIR
jgi:hypothetical protein